MRARRRLRQCAGREEHVDSEDTRQDDAATGSHSQNTSTEAIKEAKARSISQFLEQNRKQAERN